MPWSCNFLSVTNVTAKFWLSHFYFLFAFSAWIFKCQLIRASRSYKILLFRFFQVEPVYRFIFERRKNWFLHRTKTVGDEKRILQQSEKWLEWEKRRILRGRKLENRRMQLQKLKECVIEQKPNNKFNVKIVQNANDCKTKLCNILNEFNIYITKV